MLDDAETWLVQLRRGSKNRGTLCVAFMVANVGMMYLWTSFQGLKTSDMELKTFIGFASLQALLIGII
jgi:hypothetical protein